MGFADIAWTEHLASSVGYSFVWVDNTSGQSPNAFHIGHYALANYLWKPTKDLMFGLEFQWGRRENNSDGFGADDFRLQFSAKYAFSASIGGAKK
jgi:hypothetical protein